MTTTPGRLNVIWPVVAAALISSSGRNTRACAASFHVTGVTILNGVYRVHIKLGGDDLLQ